MNKNDKRDMLEFLAESEERAHVKGGEVHLPLADYQKLTDTLKRLCGERG